MYNCCWYVFPYPQYFPLEVTDMYIILSPDTILCGKYLDESLLKSQTVDHGHLRVIIITFCHIRFDIFHGILFILPWKPYSLLWLQLSPHEARQNPSVTLILFSELSPDCPNIRQTSVCVTSTVTSNLAHGNKLIFLTLSNSFSLSVFLSLVFLSKFWH